MKTILTKLKSFIFKKQENSLRESIEELIEGRMQSSNELGSGEHTYLFNILKLNDLKVSDVMVPRVDICAIDLSMSLDEIIQEVLIHSHSRFPVFKKTLDNVTGMIHIRDLTSFLVKHDKSKRTKKKFEALIRPVLIIAPSMAVVDLLIKMQKERQHLAVVVDEYGGIDGLATIEDIVEEIVGEIEDEHDKSDTPHTRILKNGHIIADSRVEIEEVLNHFRVCLDKEDEDIDTIGGFVFLIAGHIPIRGEILQHEFETNDGDKLMLEFKILDADMRKVKRVKISRASVTTH